MAENLQVKGELIFDYDPSEIQQFYKDMGGLKNELQDVVGKSGDLKDSLKGIKDILSTIATAATGVFGLDQILEAEDVERDFKGFWGSFTAQGIKAARDIAKNFEISFHDVQRALTRIGGDLTSLGLGRGAALKGARTIIERAKAVANERGKSFEDEILPMFRSFIKGGNFGQLASFFGFDEKTFQEKYDKYRGTSLAQKPEAAAGLDRLAFLRSLTGGAHTKWLAGDRSARSNLDAAKASLENLIDAWAKEMLPTTKAFTSWLAKATAELEKFAPILAALTPAIAAIVAGKAGGKVLGTLGAKKAGRALGNLGVIGGAGAGGYYGGKLFFEWLFDKYPGLEEKIHGVLGEGFSFLESAEKRKQAFDIIKDLPGVLGLLGKLGFGVESFKQKHSPKVPALQGGKNLNQNITVNIDAKTDNPEKMGERFITSIEKISNKVFKRNFEREIPGQTSAEF